MARSETRIECDNAVRFFSNIINSNIRNGNLLYVGIAGDPVGGEYSPLFPSHRIITFDYDKKWKPEIAGDITIAPFKDYSCDIIVCVQVIEHVANLFKLPEELYRLLKTKGYIIIDCPWNYPYHAEPPSFKDYWRLSKDGMEELFGKKFKIEKLLQGNHNTSCLLRKI